MGPDDHVCLCHHVSMRKLVNFARREQPRHAAQMSDCLGAGTGCGWCIPMLARIAELRAAPPELQARSAEDYEQGRVSYRSAKREAGDGDSQAT